GVVEYARRIEYRRHGGRASQPCEPSSGYLSSVGARFRRQPLASQLHPVYLGAWQHRRPKYDSDGTDYGNDWWHRKYQLALLQPRGHDEVPGLGGLQRRYRWIAEPDHRPRRHALASSSSRIKRPVGIIRRAACYLTV